MTKWHPGDWRASSKTRAFCAPAGYTVGGACCPTLDMIGLATVFPDRPMPFRWQNAGICLPKVGVADGTLAVDGRDRRPQPACGCFGPCPDCHANDFTCVAIDGQPDPFLFSFGADERPQLITFQNQLPLFCSVTVTERGTAAYLLLT